MLVYATVSRILFANRRKDAALEIIRPHRKIEERIKELCSKAATAVESDVPAVLVELKALLAEHSEFVRCLSIKTMNRVNKAGASDDAA